MNIKNVDLKAIKFHQEDTNSVSGNSELLGWFNGKNHKAESLCYFSCMLKGKFCGSIIDNSTSELVHFSQVEKCCQSYSLVQ